MLQFKLLMSFISALVRCCTKILFCSLGSLKRQLNSPSTTTLSRCASLRTHTKKGSSINLFSSEGKAHLTRPETAVLPARYTLNPVHSQHAHTYSSSTHNSSEQHSLSDAARALYIKTDSWLCMNAKPQLNASRGSFWFSFICKY